MSGELVWKKVPAERVMVVFACDECGAAAIWYGNEAADVACEVPTCDRCERWMTFSHVCVGEGAGGDA